MTKCPMDELNVLYNAYHAGFFDSCQTQDDITTRLENLFGRQIEHFHQPGFFGSAYLLEGHLVQGYTSYGPVLFWRFFETPADPADFHNGYAITNPGFID